MAAIGRAVAPAPVVGAAAPVPLPAPVPAPLPPPPVAAHVAAPPPAPAAAAAALPPLDLGLGTPMGSPLYGIEHSYNWCRECAVEDGILQPHGHDCIRACECCVNGTCGRDHCGQQESARRVWYSWVLVVSLATLVIVLVYISLYDLRDIIEVGCIVTNAIVAATNCTSYAQPYICLQSYQRLEWYLPADPPPNGTSYHHDVAISGGLCRYTLVTGPTATCNVNATSLLLDTIMPYIGVMFHCWVNGNTGEYFSSFLLGYISDGETIESMTRKYRNTLVPMVIICIAHFVGTFFLYHSTRWSLCIKRLRRRAIRRAILNRQMERARVAARTGGIVYTREDRHQYHTSAYVPLLMALKYPRLRNKASSLNTLVNDPLYDSAAMRLIGAFTDSAIAQHMEDREKAASLPPPPSPSDAQLFTVMDTPILPPMINHDAHINIDMANLPNLPPPAAAIPRRSSYMTYGNGHDNDNGNSGDLHNHHNHHNGVNNNAHHNDINNVQLASIPASSSSSSSSSSSLRLQLRHDGNGDDDDNDGTNEVHFHFNDRT